MMEDLDFKRLFLWLFYVLSAFMIVQIANTIKKDPQTAQKFNSRFLRSSFIFASDDLDTKLT